MYPKQDGTNWYQEVPRARMRGGALLEQTPVEQNWSNYVDFA